MKNFIKPVAVAVMLLFAGASFANAGHHPVRHHYRHHRHYKKHHVHHVVHHVTPPPPHR